MSPNAIDYFKSALPPSSRVGYLYKWNYSLLGCYGFTATRLVSVLGGLQRPLRVWRLASPTKVSVKFSLLRMLPFTGEAFAAVVEFETTASESATAS